MAWTYDPTLPTEKDQVRLMIGDTDQDNAEFSNEEINALITLHGGARAAAVAAAGGLAAKYSRHADKWVGDLKILASQKAKAFAALATTLGNLAIGYTGVPSAGGIRISQKDTMEEDTNRVEPKFKVNMFPYSGCD